jgi:ABC-type sugar transport system substrate-binding protein
MRWKTCGAVAICTATLAAAGCGDSQEEPAGDGAAPAEGVEGKKLVFLACPTSNPNCAALNKEIGGALDAAGVEVTKLENDFDPAAQVQQFNQAIAQKPDAILVLATDSKSIVPSVRKAKQAGIPVINMDGPIDPAGEEDVALQILPDNEQLGKFAAQNVVEGLQASGQDEGKVIAITGTKASLITEDRMRGFNEELAKTPEYELVATEDGNWDAVQSGKIAQELFAKFDSEGGIQAAYGMADYQAVPIVQAAKQAGLDVGAGKKGLIVTGSNCTKSGVDAIRKGDMFGTATADPGTQGKDTAEWVIKFLAGEEPEKRVILPQDRVTKDNVDEFYELCAVS